MIIRKSEQAGFGIMPVYPAPVSGIPELAAELLEQECSNAKKLTETLLTIPLHPYVLLSDLDKMISLLQSVCPEEFGEPSKG